MAQILSILVSQESQNPKGFQKVPGAPKSRRVSKGCVCVRTGYTACMVSGARFMRLQQIRWNESVCFKYSPNIKQAFKKTGNQTGNHMRPKSGRTRRKGGSTQCKGRFWFYPRRSSRRAQQGKARRGEPLNSIRLHYTNPEESEGLPPNQSLSSVL